MRFLYTLATLLVFLGLQAQPSLMNAALNMRLSNSKNTDETFTLLVKGSGPDLQASQSEGNYRLNYVAGDIASVTLGSAGLRYLAEHRLIRYAELIEAHKQPMNDTMVVRNRIKPVKEGQLPLEHAYNGDSVLIGFIDTGVDFNHPDFKDSLGHSRIKFLWDQSPGSGSSVPAPYNYGIEWTDAQINSGTCTHDDLAHYGHGTHVVGIGAGNGRANNTHQGCASKADIVVVALDFSRSGPTIADAVDYIFSKATLLNKPCVINISVGDYYGSHDGTNLEAKLIDNLVSNLPGRVIVAAVGNAGNIKHHVKTQVQAGDTLFTWLNNGSTTGDYWCYADTSQIRHVKFSVGANRTSYGNLGRIGFKNYDYALNAVKTDTLKNNGNRIGIVRSAASINAYGVYELYMHIDADTSGLNWRVESAGSGLHHAWNFDFVSSGLPALAQYTPMTHYVMPDTMYTIVSSFQCSDEIITVGNYINLNRFYDVNDTLRNTGETTGEIAPTSSNGPTRDGRQKPEITASGHNIFSCLPLGMQANLIANAPQIVAQGSMHVQGGGSSASSPVVAGLAALYLQRHPQATNQDVRTAIINCAYRDNFTGTQLPSYRWGYGKLDGKATMQCGELNNVGITANEQKQLAVHAYPNPFDHSTHIDLGQKMNGQLQVYNAAGQLLFQDTISSAAYELRSASLKGTSGLLLIRITSNTGNYSFRLIKD